MTSPTTCPSGHVSPAGASYCTACGLPVGRGHDRPVSVMRVVCPAGHHVTAGDVYCATCGSATVEGVVGVDEPAPIEPAGRPTTVRGGIRALAARRVAPRTAVLVLALVVALAAGAFAIAHQVKTRYTRVDGTLTLWDVDAASSSCAFGGYRYPDITTGATFTVSDERNTLLGVVTLGRAAADRDSTHCVWSFRFDHVRTDAEFYVFEVGRQGPVIVAQAILEAKHWTQSLTLTS